MDTYCTCIHVYGSVCTYVCNTVTPHIKASSHAMYTVKTAVLF